MYKCIYMKIEEFLILLHRVSTCIDQFHFKGISIGYLFYSKSTCM